VSRRFFITGTDTDVGKTVISRALCRAFVRRGLRVAALKPVESGAKQPDGTIRPPDATALLHAVDSAADFSSVCAFAFSDPVSPHLAAARENRVISEADIQSLLTRHTDADIVVAEGAGGFLVPLRDDLLYADVIARSGFPLIIVAANRLGAINATLLTIEAARSRNIPIAGVILNGTPPSELGNAEAIVLHGGVKLIGCFPAVANLEGDDADNLLAALAETHLDLNSLLI